MIVFLSVGCTLPQMQVENEARTRRIDTKIRDLSQLQTRQRTLLQEQRDLTQEGVNQQLALNDLEKDLEQLRKGNVRLRTETRRQQEAKADLERKIRRYQQEIEKLRDDNGSPDEAKKKRIAELRKSIQDSLDLLAVQ
jgi:hypothetical protein